MRQVCIGRRYQPARTYISYQEKSAPQFKVAKDCFGLLLYGNTSGDFKCEPMVIYHSKISYSLKGVVKPTLLLFAA